MTTCLVEHCPSPPHTDDGYCSPSCRRIHTLHGQGVLIGDQQPTFLWVPQYESTAGLEVVELARDAGLYLDPWQQLLAMHAFAEDRAGAWLAFEVAIIVSRQNGKGSLLEAAELAWLFLFGEKLVMHSAHLFETSRKHFLRMKMLIESNPDFDRRVLKCREGRGAEAFELRGGAELAFVTRKGGAGRGFTGSKLVMDECMYLDRAMMAAGLPVLATSTNAQVWYTGSAGFRTSTQLADVRRRAARCDDPALMYAEWSLDNPLDPEAVKTVDRSDPRNWARVNPGQGIRISLKYIQQEARTLGGCASDEFGTERLGIGDYPPDEDGWSVIPQQVWDDAQVPDTVWQAARPRVAFGLHADPERLIGTIAVYGINDLGKGHVEVVARHRGLDWMVDWLAARRDSYDLAAVVMLAGGPLAALEKRLTAAKIPLHCLAGAPYAEACMDLATEILERDGVRHLGQHSMNTALASARKTVTGRGSWVWDQSAGADQAPVVAASLARYGFLNPVRSGGGWAQSADELFGGRPATAERDDLDDGDFPGPGRLRRGAAGYASILRGNR
jgi:hypothetical protein